MRIWVMAAAILLAATGADAQVINGSGNGNNNTGIGTGNGNGNGNGNASNNTSTASTGNSTASTGSTSSNVTIQGRRNNTPTVIAPSLAAAGTESCLGSASVGGAGPGFGVTIAGTITDRGCNLRLYARTLYNLGHRRAATLILCNDPDVARALWAEGVRCPDLVAAEVALLAPAARPIAAAPPAPTLTAPVALPVPESGTRVRTTCMTYDVFRGCLDRP